ncbi:hypothetical protein DERP_011371 [Dermatophagoides pteronyssinus]|uniref:Uncharacterized protein n=1 Tax=Dermatophagoides pteronyssinus TaxID=6956 RepID=A0ABQ8J7I2_DERPT|nr:hypothetical protein DERP_011371 [Dermatophagoides pteronyssinus]
MKKLHNHVNHYHIRPIYIIAYFNAKFLLMDYLNHGYNQVDHSVNLILFDTRIEWMLRCDDYELRCKDLFYLSK